jgi:hypothetical protein
MGGTAGVPVIGHRHLPFELSAVLLAFHPYTYPASLLIRLS